MATKDSPAARVAKGRLNPSGSTQTTRRKNTSSDPAASDQALVAVEGKRWWAEFDRRSGDARAGLHHPLLHEMILGMPPLHDSYEADAQIFAERLLVRLAEDGITDGSLVERLRALSCAPTREAYFAAANALEVAYDQRSTSSAQYLADGMARCEYYAAQKGAPGCAFFVAGRALLYACYGRFLDVERRELAQAALGWLLLAALDLSDLERKFGPPREGTPINRVETFGREAYDALIRLASAQRMREVNPAADELADA